jgi:nitroimidazol reductase NimA-like FMN-containing flavoprotein (pyridoxamine 5'-phosphate oxidase superfamily)
MMTYHMRRKDREITERGKIVEVIKSGQYAVIGLCKASDPYVVSMSYGFDKETDTFYFHGAKEGQKIDFIKSNPKACLTIVQDNGYQDSHCTHVYTSVIVRGEMVLIDDTAERVRAIKTMITHLETDGEKQHKLIDESNKVWRNTQMFKLKIDSMTCKDRPEMEEN